MTIQERYDAIKADAAKLGQQHQQAIAQIKSIEQQMIRVDAQMKLLEALLADSGGPVPIATPDPLPFPKKRRGRKPESVVA